MNKQQAQLSIENYEVVNDFVLLSFSDGVEGMVSLQILRDNCPCAGCAGEKDIFGNVYKGPPQLKTESSYQLSGLQPVGYYGLRPFWKDGHNTGIFTAKLLNSMLE